MDSREPPHKVVKLDKYMDPMEYIHSDVYELIFQHFNSADVLESSMISPEWFEATAISQKCLSKLHLRIVVPYNKEEAEKYNKISEYLKSERNYQNIYLDNFQNIVPEIIRMMTGRKWKKVFLSVRNLENKTDFIEIMKLIEPSVENLSISRTTIRNSVIEDTNLTFPALKKLELHRSCGLLMKEIAVNCKTLRHLKIDTDISSWNANAQYLRQILANNEHLEKLTLWKCSAKHAFNMESIKQYRFKLKTFVYQNSGDQFGAATDEEENCLRDFLISQSESLETLRIEEWFGVEVLKLIFQMPKLHHLTLDLDDAETSIDWDNLHLHPSMSIKKFHIDSISKVRICTALFNALPNLRILTIDRLNNDTLNAVGSRCQMLEELEIQELRANRIDDPLYFPNIKRLHCEDRINMRVKRRINIKPIERRTTFEQLVLTARPYFVTQ